MNYIKISVTFKTFDGVKKFEKTKPMSFWDFFNSKMSACVSNGRVVSQETAFLGRTFIIKCDSDPDELKEKLISAIGTEINTDEFIITTSITEAPESSSAEPEKESGSGIRDALERFTESLLAAREEEASSDEEENEPAVEEHENEPKQAENNKKESNEEKEEKEDFEAKADEDKETLSDEIEKITNMRKELLSKVFGQRHAVEELVQTIFECDAFNSQDKERQRPLATFLFTGPSGVGKTHLAQVCADLLKLGKPLVVDMSEYSDNLANNKFNGENDRPAIVTSYARKNPHGIIIFDEIEKAHINTIYLFLQILDRGVLYDAKAKKEVSFKNNIIIITTNAGKSLYDDATKCNLSDVSRKVILEALRTDRKPDGSREPYFPECITTRFANGHVVLFNHLEPYSLMQIIATEIRYRISLFEKAYGIKVECDIDTLSAAVLYSAGGATDARTLKSFAKDLIVKELQSAAEQAYYAGSDVAKISRIKFEIQADKTEDKVRELFISNKQTTALVFSDKVDSETMTNMADGKIAFNCVSEESDFKKEIRGVVDYLLIDPLCGLKEGDRVPADIEDVKSDGMDMISYALESYPEIPVYIFDSKKEKMIVYETLLSKGARGTISFDPGDTTDFRNAVGDLSTSALINNSAYRLARSAKYLRYNAAQYIDGDTITVSLERMELKVAHSSSDKNSVVNGTGTDETFDSIVGCDEAKKQLGEFCKYIKNPREYISSGKKIPKGILLYGPPGTGKTMLARAMANEADVSFIPCTATSFFASYVGQTEANIRDAFAKARKYSPSILFIDEVDAIARKRTGSTNSVHNEDALNELIAQMEGFNVDEKRPVFIMAATNYSIDQSSERALDGAFVRRFDKHIYIPLPDSEARYKLFKILLKKHGVVLESSTEETFLRNIASRSSGMSNADISTMIDGFLRRDDSDTKTVEEALMEHLDTFRFGETKNRKGGKELRQTAIHEAGHALIYRLLSGTPSFITIVSRSNHGGFMEYADELEKTSFTYEEFLNKICCSLAGRCAEILVYGDKKGNNTGAGADLANARRVAVACLDDYAMGENLFRKSTSRECEALMREQYDRCTELLTENRNILEALADLLVDKMSLDKAAIEEFFTSQNI